MRHLPYPDEICESNVSDCCIMYFISDCCIMYFISDCCIMYFISDCCIMYFIDSKLASLM